MDTLDRFVKWVQLKIYQLEVTFAVYIFTPTEKFVFYSVMFLLFGLALIATILYLPQHIVFLLNRAWWYIHGDEASDVVEAVAGLAAKGVKGVAGAAGLTIGGTTATTSISTLASAAAGVVREL